MMTLASLQARYESVKNRIGEAAARSGRGADQIMLVAVTKTAEPDQIRELIQLGHVDFGENRVQHLLQRAAIIDEWLARHRTMSSVAWNRAGESLMERGAPRKGAGAPAREPDAADAAPKRPVRWHMIGHLQRNKVKKVVETCRLIHSVDTLRVAEEIQAVAVRRQEPVDVLLQVNCSGESQKFGCAIPAALHLAEQIETMLNVRLRGMMTMAALGETPEKARYAFARCRELFEDIRDSGVVSPHFNILSMGMSSDFEVAIEEGANMLRVGSAIFGEGTQNTAADADDED